MLKKIKKFILYFGLVLALLGVIVFTIGAKHENDSKKLLATELTNLTPPPSCTISQREYTTGGLDTDSTWFVTYLCNTTGKQAYDFITANLNERGYKSKKDFSKGGPNIFYSFTYISDRFRVDYRFGGLNGTTYGLEQKSLLEQSPVSEININLSRNK